MEVKKFWNFTEDAEEGRVLRFDGTIAAEEWWGDEITPAMFLAELSAGTGDVTIWLNSFGGDCIAASRIYAMLMDYKGNITVKIDGIAASAASVVAMAGTQVLMAPTAQIMIHNPWTFALGTSAEMRKAADMLDSIKESIVNAYELKTGLSRDVISEMMDSERFIHMQEALDMGFADGMLERNPAQKTSEKPQPTEAENKIRLLEAMNDALINKVLSCVQKAEAPPEPQGIPFESLTQRLNLILH